MTRIEAKLETNLTLYIEITRYLLETYICDMYSSIRRNEEISRNYHLLETILSGYNIIWSYVRSWKAAKDSNKDFGAVTAREIRGAPASAIKPVAKWVETNSR